MKKPKPKNRDDSRRPKYRIFLGKSGGGYYSADSQFKGVSKEQADQLFHKEANNIRNYLHRTLGYKGAAIELVSSDTPLAEGLMTNSLKRSAGWSQVGRVKPNFWDLKSTF